MSEIIATVEYENYSAPRVVVDAVGIQGISASEINLTEIKDVDTSTLINGSVLVFKTNTNKWTSTTTLDAQDMEGGEF